MSRRSFVALSLGGAVSFGLIAGLVHGNDGGIRGALGNLSAPWLLVALLPAWWAGSWVRGAVLGSVATLVALVGFYAGLTATTYGHLGAPRGVLPSFVFVLAANRIWFVAGLISGPLVGGAGGLLGARGRTTWLAPLVGMLLLCEIGVVVSIQDAQIPVLGLGWSTSDWRGYQLESALGVLVLAALAVRNVRARR